VVKENSAPVRTSLLWLTGLLLIFMGAAAAAPSPTAQVDRDTLQLGETLTLVLSVQDKLSPAAPDLTPLRDHFDIVSSHKSSRHSLTNGRRESVTEWHVELTPRHAGMLTVPALSVGGGRTEPLIIKVLPAAPISDHSDARPIFTEAVVDQDTVHVQQQVLLTVRIFQAIELEDMSITEPSFDHAMVRQVHQTRYQRRIGNTPYRVHELVYAIFPEQAGELIIPELVFSARQRDPRRSRFDFGSGSPVRLLTPQLEVTVQPPPDALAPHDWLPARAVVLREQWHGDPTQLREGEAVTRRIELVVEGQPAAYLADLVLPEVDGLRQYGDQPRREESESSTGVEGRLIQSVALVPTQAGTLTLPAVRVQWWNTVTRQWEIAELPERLLHVAAAPAASPTLPSLDAPALDPLEDSAAGPTPAAVALWPWQLATTFLTVLWLATLGAWWVSLRGRSMPGGKRRRATPAMTSEKAAWRQLCDAISAGDASATRSALLNWASCYWAPQRFTSLQAFDRFIGEPALHAALEALQQQLYGKAPSQPWQGDDLLKRLKSLRRHSAASTPATPLATINPF